jgi:hypothetical protein
MPAIPSAQLHSSGMPLASSLPAELTDRGASRHSLLMIYAKTSDAAECQSSNQQ